MFAYVCWQTSIDSYLNFFDEKSQMHSSNVTQNADLKLSRKTELSFFFELIKER